MSKSEEILKMFEDAIMQIQEEEKKYTFFNKDSFQKKFKNLLAFVCCIGSIKDNFTNIYISEADYSYLYEKYQYYITNKTITEEEKEKVITFSTSLKKLLNPDTLISKWNEAFGKDSFYDISTEPNYRRGLHKILKERLFDVYMNNLFNKSKRYKIWKLLESEKGR